MTGHADSCSFTLLFEDSSGLSIVFHCSHVTRDTEIKGYILELIWQSLTKPLGICPSTQQPQHSESTAKMLIEGQPCLFTLLPFKAQWWEKVCSSFSCRYSLGNALKQNKTGSPWLNTSRLYYCFSLTVIRWEPASVLHFLDSKSGT